MPAETLPEGAAWAYELKLDGYRALGIKTGGEVRLRSRNDKDFNRKYPGIRDPARRRITGPPAARWSPVNPPSVPTSGNGVT